MAVCYSLSIDLSLEMQGLTEQIQTDLAQEPENQYGYRFYKMPNSYIAIFELLESSADSGRPWADKICMPALKNAILQYCPEYAETYNQEWLDFLNSHPDWGHADLIQLTPDVGTDFYCNRSFRFA